MFSDTVGHQLALFTADEEHAGRTTQQPRLEGRWDTAFVARLALREKQIQQTYRPIIQIHKWFARRPGSVFRSLLLSEFGERPLSEDYFLSHDIGAVIADPFMGGGTTVFESSRLGMSVIGRDINPMAWWTVRQGVSPLDLTAFRAEAERVISDVRDEVGDLYRTRCTCCGEDADVKYMLHVKTCLCPACGTRVDLFPGLRVSDAARHPREVYHCPECNELHEVEKTDHPVCPVTGFDLRTRTTVRGSTTCRHCGEVFKYAPLMDKPPVHCLYGIEYRCASCYGARKGRQFKTPDVDDLARIQCASKMLTRVRNKLRIPDEPIPDGDETRRLHRWGYSRWCELFSDRQLLGLGTLLNRIERVENREVRFALATVFSDFLRYQNLLCRYDTYALKCQDVFAVHGFPVALLACENSLLGIPGVGSGAFVHFVEKYAKAKAYAKHPYEIIYDGHKKRTVTIDHESIEASLTHSVGGVTGERSAWLSTGPSQDLRLTPDLLDAVVTDPPYFDMVQYSELMDFCYVWLRKFMGGRAEFSSDTTSSDFEATGNKSRMRGMKEFAASLSEVFCTMSAAMKSGAPLVFTYHHNDPEAYVPLIIAILDAGLNCTAVLAAPGEMAASLHIAGTKSSIIDSVFVCRAEPVQKSASVADRVAADVDALLWTPYTATRGDKLCLEAGHAASDVIRRLWGHWDSSLSVDEKFDLVHAEVMTIKKEAGI